MRIFQGVKAFVLEETYTLLDIYHNIWVHLGTERNEEDGHCAAGVGAKLHRDY